MRRVTLTWGSWQGRPQAPGDDWQGWDPSPQGPPPGPRWDNLLEDTRVGWATLTHTLNHRPDRRCGPWL